MADLYLDGRLAEILRYNETDAVTTHLLMLRVAHVTGFLSDDAYGCELLAVEGLVKEQAAWGKAQFARFWETWKGGGVAPVPARSAEPAAGTAGVGVAGAQAERLWAQWKEFLGQVKAAHGSQLAAALSAVRGVSAEGGVLVLHFGVNEFSHNFCERESAALTLLLAPLLGAPTVTLQMRLGGPPAV